jgi:hypothetical protein
MIHLGHELGVWEVAQAVEAPGYLEVCARGVNRALPPVRRTAKFKVNRLISV